MPLFKLLISFVASAQVATTSTSTTQSLVFSDLATCKSYFAKLSTAEKAKYASDTSYCGDKVGDVIKLCLASKINAYVKEAKLTAFTQLSNSEQRSKEATFKYQCEKEEMGRQAQARAEADRVAQVQAAQQAAAAQQQQAAGNAGGSGQNGMQSAAQAANLGLGISDRIDAKIDKANGGSTATQGAARTSNNDASSTTRTASPADGSTTAGAAPAEGSATPSGYTGNNSGVTSQSADWGDGQGGVVTQNMGDGSTRRLVVNEDGSGSVVRTNEYGQESTSQLSQAEMTKYVNEGTAAQGQLQSNVGPVQAEMPGAATQAESLAKNADGSFSSVPTTQVSATAQAKNSELTSGVAAAINGAQPVLSAGGTCPPFVNTINSMQAFNAEVQQYVQKKQAECVPMAEKTQFLCVEGSSPGAIAAKELMNSAGPIISLISSAQKTCSSTAKVTKLVQTGLTVAAGVCVAAKMACNAKCGLSEAELAKLKANALAKIQSSLQADTATAQSACTAQNVASAACWAQYATKAQAATGMLGQINASLGKEMAPTEGTTKALIAKCNSHVKDIIRFGLQVLGTAAAQKNAANCEKQLAATANPNISMQQYCEKKENASTEWCKCQANPNTAGCPNAVANADKGTGSTGDTATGTNVRNTAGNSAFAGGFGKNSGNPISFGKNNGLPGSQAAEEGAGARPGAAAGFADQGSGSGAGAGGSASSGGGAGSGSSAKDKLGKEPEKKWSFGAFSAGSLGGYNPANAAKGKAGSGGKMGTDPESIKRQIASDQFSSQVSSASGKSNWEKVKQMYSIKETSLLVGK